MTGFVNFIAGERRVTLRRKPQRLTPTCCAVVPGLYSAEPKLLAPALR